MKQTNIFRIVFQLFGIALVLSSCSKQIGPFSRDGQMQHGISEIRKIIGDDGAIKIIDTNVNNYSENQSESTKGVNQLRKLTLEEFRNVYNSLRHSKITFTTISNNRFRPKIFTDKSSLNTKIKSNDFDNIDAFYPIIEDTSKPGIAGYHHAVFYPNSDLNKNLLGWYSLHLFFNTDASGHVIGDPSISYTGMGLFSWQQVNTSTISFNSNTLVSNFVITGIGIYGIQFEGVTFGWSDLVNYHIRIDMNQSADKQVTLQQNQ